MSPWVAAVLLQCACAPSPTLSLRSCARPAAGVHGAGDEAFWQKQARWVAPPAVHVIKVDREGGLKWNGSATTREEIDGFLALAAGMTPEPFVSVDFDAGTDCAAINRVRWAIERHLDCADSQRCLQGPAPSWAR